MEYEHYRCHCCHCCHGHKGCKPCGYKRTISLPQKPSLKEAEEYLDSYNKYYSNVPSGETLIKNLTLTESNRYMEAINGAHKMRHDAALLLGWYAYEYDLKYLLKEWWEKAEKTHAN